MFVISISANGTKVFPFCLFPHRSSDSMTTTILRTSFVINRYGKISYIAAFGITTTATAAATSAATTVIIIIVHFPSIHIYPFLVENKGQKKNCSRCRRRPNSYTFWKMFTRENRRQRTTISWVLFTFSGVFMLFIVLRRFCYSI